MEFFEKYQEDIKAFIDALIDFFKAIFAKFTAEDEEAAQ